MNNFEKMQNAIHLGPVTCKQDIPVYAHMCTYAAKLAGVSQKHIFSGNDAYVETLTKAYEVLGVYPDAVFPLGPADISFGEMMKVKIPGRELDDDALFQFVEEQIMTQEDYHTVINAGLYAWQFPYLASIQNPPIPFDEHLFEAVGGRYMELGMHMGQNIGYWAQKGIPTFFHNSVFPAFDMFSLARGLEDFFFDLYDEPELVKAACNAATPVIIETALQNAQPGCSICIWAMRSGSTFISPEMFEEFVWPNLKQIIEAFHAAGVTSVIHCDADWSKQLHFFKEVPKGSCIIELDGDTDIVKAKEILHGYQCIAGDMPASILAFGTEEETQEYCDKLIELAMDGGFIIRSGCEIPLNCKPENLKVFLNCCK